LPLTEVDTAQSLMDLLALSRRPIPRARAQHLGNRAGREVLRCRRRLGGNRACSGYRGSTACAHPRAPDRETGMRARVWETVRAGGWSLPLRLEIAKRPGD